MLLRIAGGGGGHEAVRLPGAGAHRAGGGGREHQLAGAVCFLRVSGTIIGVITGHSGGDVRRQADSPGSWQRQMCSRPTQGAAAAAVGPWDTQTNVSARVTSSAPLRLWPIAGGGHQVGDHAVAHIRAGRSGWCACLCRRVTTRSTSLHRQPQHVEKGQ